MKIKIELEKNSYFVNINEDINLNLKSKVAIVTNAKVGGLWLGFLLNHIKADEIFIITLKDGEEYKNQDSINEILEQLFISKFSRKDTLIALGGGVISDMTGFAASIYERGINFVNIPTTLLAQVDASVGGKTGINNKFGKNLIGSFYQPKAVFCNTLFLKTLPKREFNAGVCEAIKMAIMFDKDFFEFFEKTDLKNENDIKFLIQKSVEIKTKIVSLDEKESGIRVVLNYGHTFGHVIENFTNYRIFLHGEAIAIGIIMANSLALKLNLISKNEFDKIKILLEKFELPTNFKVENPQNFYDAFFLDKKTLDNKIKFILPQSIGNFAIKDDIKKETLLEILGDFR